MKLMTKELEAELPQLYTQEHTSDPLLRAKYFHPLSSYTYYVLEYDPGDRLFFGYADTGDPATSELGYASLDEMEQVVVMGLGLERDLYFDPIPLSEVKR